MGTTLTGTTPQDTYDSLIKVTDNGPIGATAKYLSDGLGNDSVLALSTTAVGVGVTAPQGVFEAVGLSYFTRSSKSLLINPNYGGTDINVQLQAATAMGLSLATNGDNDRLFITSAGNVGIGTGSPNRNAEIVASSGAVLGVSTSGSGSGIQYGRIAMYSTFGSNSFIDYGGEIRSYSGAGIDYSDLRFYTAAGASSTEKVRITSAGVLSLTQGQIQFPATQVPSADVNTLDDYEEGTWTMGVSFGGASVGVTYDIQGATYTKIGRQVTVNGFIILSNKGSSTGVAEVTGLPFTIANTSGNYSTASVRLEKVTFANQFQAYGKIATTVIALNETTEAGVNGSLTDADFVNDSTVMVSFTYFV